MMNNFLFLLESSCNQALYPRCCKSGLCTPGGFNQLQVWARRGRLGLGSSIWYEIPNSTSNLHTTCGQSLEKAKEKRWWNVAQDHGMQFQTCTSAGKRERKFLILQWWCHWEYMIVKMMCQGSHEFNHSDVANQGLIFIVMNALKFWGAALPVCQSVSSGTSVLWIWFCGLSITTHLCRHKPECLLRFFHWTQSLRRGDLIKFAPVWKGKALSFNKKTIEMAA